MPTSLRVLLLEDRRADAELTLHALRRSGFAPEWLLAETEAEYLAALDPALDLILADYSLPQFDALRALELMRARGLDIPFIIVSGTIGEELAVAAMRQGAADYLLKDRLARLGTAVERALEQRQLRLEMQRAEAALQENARLHQAVLRALTAQIAVLDASGTIIAVNDAWMQFAREHGDPRLQATGVGVNYLEICRRAATHFNDPEAAVILAGLQAIFDGHESHFALKYGCQTPTEMRWFMMQATPMASHGGVVIAHEDITAVWQAEEALRESEERYRLIAEHTEDLISLRDQAGRFVYVNPSYQQVLGYNPSELIGRAAVELVHPDDHLALQAALRELTHVGTAHVTQRQQHADGSWRWIDEQVTAAVQHGAGYSVGMGRDITERRRLEAQFLQAQKMESVGQLAGGIAHDFNNLLTAISGYAELALVQLPVDAEIAGDLDEIIKAAARAATLTSQLLAFARKQVIEPQVLNLNVLLAEIEKLLRRLIGADIELVTRLAPDLGQIKADPGQIEQVLVNLAVNARDAMLDGGKLTIETSNILLDHAFAQQHLGVTPGPYIFIAVSDTGIGMDAQTQQHAFEPFFTTKGLGHGTGLGLATCYGIVKQHGGHIWVYSEPQRGTTFTIYLPRIAASAEPQPPPLDVGNLPRGDETVLLAEDDPAVRALAARVLREQGYTLLEAADGEAALRLAYAHTGAPIHLLLTDLVMPHMNGKALCQQLNLQWPDMKALFISGYADDAIVQHGWLEPSMAFLHKPFSPTALARKVREVLDASSPRSGVQGT